MNRTPGHPADSTEHGGERRQHIVARVQQHRRALVGDLSAAIEVSQITIRKDLEYLQSNGLILRTHGGALRVQMFDPLWANHQLPGWAFGGDVLQDMHADILFLVLGLKSCWTESNRVSGAVPAKVLQQRAAAEPKQRRFDRLAFLGGIGNEP